MDKGASGIGTPERHYAHAQMPDSPICFAQISAAKKLTSS
jgi:hypothetical protein